MKLFKKLLFLLVLCVGAQAYAMDPAKGEHVLTKACGEYEVSFYRCVDEDLEGRCSVKAFFQGDDDAMLGYTRYMLNFSADVKHADLYALRLFKKEHSCCGIGSTLIELALEHMKEQKCSQVGLVVVPSKFESELDLTKEQWREVLIAEQRRERLCALYRRFGFRAHEGGAGMYLSFNAAE